MTHLWQGCSGKKIQIYGPSSWSWVKVSWPELWHWQELLKTEPTKSGLRAQRSLQGLAAWHYAKILESWIPSRINLWNQPAEDSFVTCSSSSCTKMLSTNTMSRQKAHLNPTSQHRIGGRSAANFQLDLSHCGCGQFPEFYSGWIFVPISTSPIRLILWVTTLKPTHTGISFVCKYMRPIREGVPLRGKPYAFIRFQHSSEVFAADWMRHAAFISGLSRMLRGNGRLTLFYPKSSDRGISPVRCLQRIGEYIGMELQQ